ncbi:MAG TPA: CotH kinase family protein [Cyclobacteriaceae bacterium]|nr:CotH kinase family protein [Cyclobacteriaceae bacterium]
MRLIAGFSLLCCCVTLHAQTVEFTSSNLPIIVLKTNGKQIVDDPKIVVDMGIIDNGAGKRNNLTDPYNGYNGKIGIEIRGSSSQMFPKKQYGIELRAANGEDDNEASIFGMPKEGDWILYAPYNDKTLIRDALSYRLGRNMGDYASRSRYFELVLNGEYMGVYVFFEKVKRGKNRVNIDKLDKDELTGDGLTGGYILKIDKTTGGDEGGFVSTYPPPGATNQRTYFQWEYPKADDIRPEQKSYIENYVKQFENVLASDNYKDSINGWTKYADLRSFVDYFIINELTKNPDAYRLSTFMYKKKDSEGGKLSMGPIWDFNLGFGNVNYCTQGTSTGLVIDFNSICPTDGWLVPFWWNKLWNDPAFRVAVSDRWSSLRQNRFTNAAVLGYVDSVASVLNVEAQQRNFKKWPVLGVYIWPNYKFDITTFDGEVAWMKTWITERMTYLDATFKYTVTGVDEPTANGVIVNAFPNPFDQEIVFDYEIPGPGVTKIEILDVVGRSVSTIVNTDNEAGRHSVRTPLVAPQGLYVYRVIYNNGRPVTGKLVRK